MGSLLENGGCLTDAGLQVVQESVPGRVPPEAAQHLARCGRCQRRLLSIDPLARVGRRKPGDAPPLWRTLLWVGVLVILSAAAFGYLLRVS
jgi:hypothetical protein